MNFSLPIPYCAGRNDNSLGSFGCHSSAREGMKSARIPSHGHASTGKGQIIAHPAISIAPRRFTIINTMMRSGLLYLFALFLALPGVAAAEASFDLAGPRLDVKVTRAGKTLPISEVPNLQEGDRL